jgi:hypothetical protein
VAVVYEESWQSESEPKNNFFAPSQPLSGRVQGSLYSQQKRKIADACAWMIKNCTFKPMIFTATSPGFTDLANESQLIKKLTHNLRNGYDCKNYVWVREFTKAGFPHFHFVADVPDFDPVSLSRYWSGLFSRTDTNSVRLGTSPRCSKCRAKLKSKGQPCYKSGCTGIGRVKYYLDNKQMAWYMSKYIGKSIGGLETMALDDQKAKGKSFRTFAVSQALSKACEPSMYVGKMERTQETRKAFTVSGGYFDMPIDKRVWRQSQKCPKCGALCLVNSYECDSCGWEFGFEGGGIDVKTDTDLHKQWQWRYTGFSSTFKGYPKEWKFKQPKPIKCQSVTEPETKPEIVCPF